MPSPRVNRPGPPSKPSTASRAFDWRDWVDPRRVGWLRLLLIFIPIALGLRFAGAAPAVQFAVALVAILPLAAADG